MENAQVFGIPQPQIFVSERTPEGAELTQMDYEVYPQALDGVQHCIADGIPVKGYFHWSLMDNFEWQKGYAMQFGLIAVNRETMERTAKPSLAVLGSYTER